jgi:hypothetical protein
VELRLPKSEETDAKLEDAGLDLMPYKASKYRIRLTNADLGQHEPLITELLKKAYEHREV